MNNETNFPPDGRRVIFYLVYDQRGNIDDYIPYKLAKLRPFAAHIVAIFNGPISAAGRAAITPVVDELWERENIGFDVGGYAMAIERFGEDRLQEFDELILMNYTWFGPVRPLGPLFDRMNAQKVGFWGMTDHGPTEVSSATWSGFLPSHIQSHWIAVRRSLFTTAEWKSYWRTMPPITSYSQSILLHESRFTSHFSGHGHGFLVAFPYQDYAPSMHPAFESALQLLDDGCPVVKRRPFFHDPLYLDREAIIGRWLVESATSQGYPEAFIWQSMTRNAPARVLYTNASMMEILPTDVSSREPGGVLRIVAILHIYYIDMVDELLNRVGYLPETTDVVVTTDSQAKADQIQLAIAARSQANLGKWQVRVVESNRGRDQSAFYVTCRDVLRSADYDIVVKIHSKKSEQDGAGPGAFFRRQQLDNLLASAEYAQNLLNLFRREPGLGVVYPPMIHMGYPTMGNAWFTNFEGAEKLAKNLGIGVSLGDGSPLAPFGGMFIARPEALTALTNREWTFDEYAEEGSYGDGTLSHIQERLVSYAVAEKGFHTRTVSTPGYAAISHTFLEYKLDQMSTGIPGYGYDQVHTVRSLAHMINGGQRSVLRYLLLRYHPRLARILLVVTKPIRKPARDFRRNIS